THPRKNDRFKHLTGFHPIALYSIKLPIHPHPPGGSLMKSLAGFLAGGKSTSMCLLLCCPEGGHIPEPRSGRAASTAEGVGHACCLPSHFSGDGAPRRWGSGVTRHMRLPRPSSGSLPGSLPAGPQRKGGHWDPGKGEEGCWGATGHKGPCA